jgi:hypothetical protein
MNKKDTRIDDLEALIHQTLKDDLPPNVETGMKRQFQDFKRALNRNEELSETEGWFRTRGPFRKEILAIASAAMIILGLVMQLSVSQNALAHSIEKLKVIVSISSSLDYVSSMDCRVMKEDARGEQVFYRIRWRTNGNVRVDMDSSESTETFWIPHETIFLAGPGGGSARSMSINTMTADPVWQPIQEFISPKVLAKYVEEHFKLMQSSGRAGYGTDEFRIVSVADRQDIEINADAQTYLPKFLRKYSHDQALNNGEQTCVMEARFLWNQPIAAELFHPGASALEQ